MWSDRETEDDCLGFTQYVPSLAEVCLEPGIAPLTVGIFGSWGSGKTSLMKMLQRAVSPAPESQIKTVWFNAWRYEGKDEIQSALINAILTKVQENRTLTDDIKTTLKRLKDGASILKLAKCIGKTAITLTPDIAGFIEAFNDESDKVVETMATFEQDFEKYLRDLDVRRVVVFIDDLDRCQSTKIVETFETIKLFLNIPECTFVLGADDAKIRQAIVEAYRVGDQTDVSFSDDYLEKIIQLPFRIPEQRLDDIRCYVSMLFLKRELNPGGWNTLLGARTNLLAGVRQGQDAFGGWVTDNGTLFEGHAGDAARKLAEIRPYIDIVASGLRGNPRQIKRFLNILSLRQRLAGHNRLQVQADLLIKLLVVEYTWRPFFKDLVETTDPSTGQSALLAEVLTVARGGEAPADSAMLKAALEAPGLKDFLLSVPVIEGDADLGPYLFLSQTALSASRPAQTFTPDETARQLTARISSDDRIRSRAGVLQARQLEGGVIDSVIRQLRMELLAAQDQRRQVNALSGLLELCRIRPASYAAVVETLGQINPSANQALAIPATTLLQNAEAANTPGAASLRLAFAAASPLAAATRSRTKRTN